VKAKEKSAPAIIDAIRQGYFYATTGIRIYDVAYENGIVSASFDRPCDMIAFPWHANGYSVRACENTTSLVDGERRYYAEAQVRPGQKYLRLELIDAHGNKAYTNPVYFE